MTKRTTIKFKGIEFEEVSNKKYLKEPYTTPYFVVEIKGKRHYFLEKGKRCSKCGQAGRWHE